MSTLQRFTIDHEVGGQDIEWHIVATKGSPATHDEPEDPDEVEVERAMLLTHLVEGKPQRLDILDLLIEAGDGELSSLIYGDLIAKLESEE